MQTLQYIRKQASFACLEMLDETLVVVSLLLRAQRLEFFYRLREPACHGSHLFMRVNHGSRGEVEPSHTSSCPHCVCKTCWSRSPSKKLLLTDLKRPCRR